MATASPPMGALPAGSIATAGFRGTDGVFCNLCDVLLVYLSFLRFYFARPSLQMSSYTT